MTSTDLIQHLHLLPHPEGGYYRETYRSAEQTLNIEGNTRNTSTAIYYLLENEDKSHFHRIKSDELWFFHQGRPLEILVLQGSELSTIVLGNDVGSGEVPQAMIPANAWFAARVQGRSGYALVSCTVAPGFDFADFELASRVDLLHEFPHWKPVIEEFTR